MTIHSEVRMQQRGIPELIVDLLINYGERKRAKKKCEVLFFNHSALKKLKKYLGKEFYSRIEQFKGAYLIQASNGEVITIGYRARKFKEL